MRSRDLVSAPVPRGRHSEAEDDAGPREIISDVTEEVKGVARGKATRGAVVTHGGDGLRVLLSEALPTTHVHYGCGHKDGLLWNAELWLLRDNLGDWLL